MNRMEDVLPYLTTRHSHLLNLLLSSVIPVSLNRLMKETGVSRRTIFRELNEIKNLVQGYGLTIKTVNGLGLSLQGNTGQLDKFKELLHGNETNILNKEQRQLILLLKLLNDEEIEKFSSLARDYRVSESTISNDFLTIGEWLSGFDLQINKKSAVILSGDELNRRRAITFLSASHPAEPIISNFINPELKAALKSVFNYLLVRATNDLAEVFLSYLTVMVQRLRHGQPILSHVFQPTFTVDHEMIRVKILLAAHFQVYLPQNEAFILSLHLEACRMKDNEKKPDRKDWLVSTLIYAFDEEKAPQLMMDNQLTEGLMAHLPAMMIRLDQTVKISNDYLNQELEQQQPVLWRNSCRALQAIGRSGSFVFNNEVSLLALHFGAALMRLEQQKDKQAQVRLGIVCVSGMGLSAMMFSQLTKYFPSVTHARIVSLQECADEVFLAGHFDLLLSTTRQAVSDAVPVVQVPPFWDEKQVGIITEAICQVSLKKKPLVTVSARQTNFKKLSQLINYSLSQTEELLNNFSILSLPSACSFNEMTSLVSEKITMGYQQALVLKDNLIGHEKIASQVLPALQLVLLHSRTTAVHHPVFKIIKPQDADQFNHPYFQGCHSGVVMLLPADSPAVLVSLMGRISSALVEEESFLQAVHACDKEKISGFLDKIACHFLEGYRYNEIKEERKE